MVSAGIEMVPISPTIKIQEKVSFSLNSLGVGIQVQGMSTTPAQIIPSTNGSTNQ
jgi:hypothetical protein